MKEENARVEKERVIAVFDIGKTNKKIFLFNRDYRVVYENSETLPETVDEDGDPCEDLQELEKFVRSTWKHINNLRTFKICAVNFSAYGASLVYLDDQGKTLAPLYNYIKPYPKGLQEELYERYGGIKKICSETASPFLGNLNSGMQLYRILKQQPELFSKIRYALHLPQYMSYLLGGKYFSELTSIGCHTALWDFSKRDYHEWVYQEGIADKMAPIVVSTEVIIRVNIGPTELNLPSTEAKPESAEPFNITKESFEGIPVGIGLHDSSAALIPYLLQNQEPFVLISTGTWCISLNPFNHSPLTEEELSKDCLCYLSFEGKPVKASRLFSGYEHEQQLNIITNYFNTDKSKYRNLAFNKGLFEKIRSFSSESLKAGNINGLNFSSDTEVLNEFKAPIDLQSFSNDLEAYYSLIHTLVLKQVVSTRLVLKGSPVKRIYIDGGFSSNEIFINMLALYFPDQKVYTSEMHQAAALGAALVLHSVWNDRDFPSESLYNFRLISSITVP